MDDFFKGIFAVLLFISGIYVAVVTIVSLLAQLSVMASIINAFQYFAGIVVGAAMIFGSIYVFEEKI